VIRACALKCAITQLVLVPLTKMPVVKSGWRFGVSNWNKVVT
jgi:hypothetical protein